LLEEDILLSHFEAEMVLRAHWLKSFLMGVNHHHSQLFQVEATHHYSTEANLPHPFVLVGSLSLHFESEEAL